MSELIGNKEIIESNRSNELARIIDPLSNSQALAINSQIVPDEFNGNRLKFLKYGLEAVVSGNDNLSPKQRIAAALEGVATPFCAISIISQLDSKTRTRIILEDCISGMKLYAYSALNAPIEVEGYYAASNASVSGGKFLTSVPSRHPKSMRYHIRFANVPVVDNPRKNILWTAITTADCGCNCNYKRSFISYRHEQERLLCSHEIAAYIAIASKLKAEGNMVPSYAIPFPLFSEQVVLFWNKLLRQVIVADGDKRPLNKAERALLVGDYIKHIGVDNSLNSGGKKLIDFAW